MTPEACDYFHLNELITMQIMFQILLIFMTLNVKTITKFQSLFYVIITMFLKTCFFNWEGLYVNNSALISYVLCNPFITIRLFFYLNDFLAFERSGFAQEKSGY